MRDVLLTLDLEVMLLGISALILGPLAIVFACWPTAPEIPTGRWVCAAAWGGVVLAVAAVVQAALS